MIAQPPLIMLIEISQYCVSFYSCFVCFVCGVVTSEINKIFAVFAGIYSFILVGAQVVSHMGNMWIGPWAIFPLYVDGALLNLTQYWDIANTESVVYKCKEIVFCEWRPYFREDPLYSKSKSWLAHQTYRVNSVIVFSIVLMIRVTFLTFF